MRALVMCLVMASWLAALPSSAQTRRYDVMDSLLAAEKSDMNDLAKLGQGPQLMGYRGVLDSDLKALTAQLQPLFAPTQSGWVDCAKVRQSLQKAMGIASTAAGLEAALVMGLRVEGMHCQGIGYGPASPDWRQNVGQALINIQGRLPSSFTQTRAILARTSPNEVLAAAAALAYNADSACMGEQLTQHRKKGLRFQDAQRRAIDTCINGRR